MDVERDLSPQQVFEALKADKAILVDVREPAEFAAERIHGALLSPLSTFDTRALPTDSARRIIFQCGSGMRSMKALGDFISQTGAEASNLAGGLKAWKLAGLPTVRINPATGKVEDNGHF